MQPQRTDCPKCRSPHAYYEASQFDLTLRCRCGFLKVVETKLETMTVQHNEAVSDVKLPRRDTNLWVTMMVLTAVEEATSAGITDRLKLMKHEFSVSDVASYLTILRAKGLVIATEIRRGVAGGSTWELTETCRTLLGI